MRPVDAQYDDGVLRLERPVSLRAGERVRVIVLRRADPLRWDLARLRAAAADEDGALAEAGLGEWAEALDAEDRR